MEKAIEVLMSEHRLIEQALGSLESYAALVHEGFSPGREMLTGPELDAMKTQFEAFETQLRAEGLLDRLSSLADRLTTRFPPNPAAMG